MDEKQFAERLASLRTKRNVSAREMSLAIGQNPSYINRIENHLNLPSMQGFFYICEYLDVSPAEFFDINNSDPHKRSEIVETLKYLDAKQLDIVLSVIQGLSSAQKWFYNKCWGSEAEGRATPNIFV